MRTFTSESVKRSRPTTLFRFGGVPLALFASNLDEALVGAFRDGSSRWGPAAVSSALAAVTITSKVLARRDVTS